MDERIDFIFRTTSGYVMNYRVRVFFSYHQNGKDTFRAIVHKRNCMEKRYRLVGSESIALYGLYGGNLLTSCTTCPDWQKIIKVLSNWVPQGIVFYPKYYKRVKK